MGWVPGPTWSEVAEELNFGEYLDSLDERGRSKEDWMIPLLTRNESQVNGTI